MHPEDKKMACNIAKTILVLIAIALALIVVSVSLVYAQSEFNQLKTY